MSALALAKAYHPEMDPALPVGGFPEFKADNTPFMKADYLRVLKETRPHATAIAHSLDLSNFQVGYDSDNQRMDLTKPEPFELMPPRRQVIPPAPPSSSTAAASAPPRVLVEEMVFESLSSMQWSKDNAEQAGKDAASQGQA